MTKRKKKRAKRVPPTELEKLRAALFKSDIFAYRRFGAKKYTLCKYQMQKDVKQISAIVLHRSWK